MTRARAKQVLRSIRKVHPGAVMQKSSNAPGAAWMVVTRPTGTAMPKGKREVGRWAV